MGKTIKTSFADVHVLLTGASRGLGAVLAEELAGRGARLSLVASNKSLLDEVGRVPVASRFPPTSTTSTPSPA